MRCCSFNRRSLKLHVIVGLTLVAASLAAGPAVAQSDDRMDHGGHMGGAGVGIGIGIGATILQQAITSHPDDGRPTDQNKRTAGKNKSGSQAPAGRGGNGGQSGVPPRGEQRFVTDEVITAFASGVSTQAIDQIARRYSLTRLEGVNLSLINSTLYRWRIAGRSVAEVIAALERERAVAAAQPNYIFALQEQPAAAQIDSAGDPAQYVLNKLRIREAHQLATGNKVVVAIIDSQVDVQHPDFAATVAKNFDALGGDAPPHKHGTAIAGAIAAHGKLLGVAPGAQILAAHAFDDGAESKGTSFAIYKCLQWALDNGARVVNMSFAGPYDPALHRLLAAAYAKDVVLIAAAGNAGPKSPPLYPAADAVVIAVTATDGDDAIFKMANRGDYIAVAAPGVDILAAAPDAAYQTTTGTSIAAAHVSGVVALLLERRATLKPKDVRAALANSAKPLAIGGPSAAGSGLINAYQALSALGGPAVGSGNADNKGRP